MNLLEKGYTDVAVDQLIKADWNYKNDDEEKSRKLTNSIKEHGFIQNIIVRPLLDGDGQPTGTLEIVNGNHRLDSLQALKMETVHAYNCGPITTAAAQRIAVETNEFAFESDMVKLAGLIESIQEEFSMDMLAETMPFSQQELDDLKELNTFDWSEFDDAQQPPPEEPGSTSGTPGNQIILQFNQGISEEQKQVFFNALDDFLNEHENVYWSNQESFSDVS